MATGSGRISLSLAVGVDRGQPQWPNLSFFFCRSPERQKWPLGVAESLSPGCWGGSRPPLVARSIFFFGFAEKVAGDGIGWRCLGS